MPSTEARVKTSIWRDETFGALPLTAQHLYLLILSQPDVSVCGVLALRASYWAELRHEAKADTLAVLDQLEAAQLVATDRRTAEVLVTGWLRHNHGLASPNVLKAVPRALSGVLSGPLRHRVSELVPEGMRALHGIPDPEVGGVSDTHPIPIGNPSRGVIASSVQSLASSVQSHVARAREGGPRPNPILGEIVPRADYVAHFCDRCQEVGEAPIASSKARIGKQAKELEKAGKSPDLILAAIDRLVGRSRPVSALLEMAREVERERAGHGVASGKQARDDATVAAAMAMMRAQEGTA